MEQKYTKSAHLYSYHVAHMSKTTVNRVERSTAGRKYVVPDFTGTMRVIPLSDSMELMVGCTTSVRYITSE